MHSPFGLTGFQHVWGWQGHFKWLNHNSVSHVCWLCFLLTFYSDSSDSHHCSGFKGSSSAVVLKKKKKVCCSANTLNICYTACQQWGLMSWVCSRENNIPPIFCILSLKYQHLFTWFSNKYLAKKKSIGQKFQVFCSGVTISKKEMRQLQFSRNKNSSLLDSDTCSLVSFLFLTSSQTCMWKL